MIAQSRSRGNWEAVLLIGVEVSSAMASNANPDVDKLISFGQMALEQGWYDQARRYFEQALALDADNEIAKQAIAQIDEMLCPKPPFRLSWAEETQAEETAKRVSGVELQAKGHNGQIELYRNKVCIRRKGVLAFLSQGLKGDKEITISSITSIQFKKAGVLTNGYMQISFMGGKEAKGGIWQATQDENTVIFTAQQQPDFERIKVELEKRIQAESVPSAPSSDADEIAKLADLRDKGILTEEEFQQKKKHILGF